MGSAILSDFGTVYSNFLWEKSSFFRTLLEWRIWNTFSCHPKRFWHSVQQLGVDANKRDAGQMQVCVFYLARCAHKRDAGQMQVCAICLARCAHRRDADQSAGK